MTEKMKDPPDLPQLYIADLIKFRQKGTELGVYLKFLLHGIDQLEQGYKKNILLHTGEMLLPTYLLQHHPSVNEARCSVHLVYTALINQLKEKIHFEFKINLELETLDEEEVFTMTEKQIKESIYYSDSQCTSLLSIIEILSKSIEKVNRFNNEFYPILKYHENPDINAEAIKLMLLELIKACILLKSMTYKVS